MDETHGPCSWASSLSTMNMGCEHG